jgi:ketosteroid isomerase-like protein
MKIILHKYSPALLASACLISTAGISFGEPAAAEAATITATVEEFHKMLAAGARDRVMSLFLPDALIVEAGTVQTRDEYQREHLAEDIALARAAPSTQRDVVVRQEGDVAWVTSTFRVTGKFQEKPIDNIAAETMVLTKTLGGWRIRAIHWSSHEAKGK